MQTDDATEMAVREDLRAANTEQPEDAEEQLEEIEHDGRFYRIPSALKGAFLMNSDYTRKTQELADHRRSLDGQRRAFEQRAELIQATAEDRARLTMLDEQLADLEGVDWETYSEQDLAGAQSLWRRYQQLGQARERFAWSLAKLEDDSRLASERDLAEQMAEAGKVLSREIDGWSPEVAAKLVEYAEAFGVTLDELRQVADTRLWKILYRAHQGEQLVRERDAARNTAQTQAVRPAVQVSGAQAEAGGAMRDELGTKEWMRRRNDQAMRAR